MCILKSIFLIHFTALVFGGDAPSPGHSTSPIVARGETPACPDACEGFPKYELKPFQGIPAMCYEGSKTCDLDAYQKRTSYFYFGVVNCCSKTKGHKSYIVLAHQTEMYENKIHFILDTATVEGEIFPTQTEVLGSIFTVMTKPGPPVVYFKLKDKSCVKVTYDLSRYTAIASDEPCSLVSLDERGEESEICKVFKDSLKDFTEQDQYNNWSDTHFYVGISKGPETVDCSEINSLKRM